MWYSVSHYWGIPMSERAPINNRDTLPGAQNGLVFFGTFEVDLRTSELRKGGLKIKLHGQPFDLLRMLLERPGALVTREELQRKLWGSGTFVDFEHGLNKAVNKLREALGDDPGNPRYIETVPRLGYRFIFPLMPHAAQPEPKQPPLRGWIVPLCAGSLTLIAVILFVVDAGGLRSRFLLRLAPPSRIHSLAVLPLLSLSEDQGGSYFTEGMTEALITELGKISALRVISHQSVMQYKGTKKSVPQIARELNVDAIVEGSVMRAGDQVRISVQLIDGGTDRHVWAENYQREMRGILSLQDEVAKAIAAEVKVKLTSQEEKLLASARAVDPEAHEAYLKGLYYVNRWPEAESVHCIESFRRATEIDPTFADAQAGLATCYTIMPWTLPPKEVFPKAKAAAKEAIRLDANQAEGYAALGAVNMFYEWDWGSAEKNLRRAVELNPNRSYSRVSYSIYFAFRGRTGEAIREAKEAVVLNPVSIFANRNLAFVYSLSRKYPEYAAQAQTTLELAPNSDVAKWDLAWALALQGKRNQSAEQLKAGTGIEPLDRAVVLATIGENDQAIRALREAGMPTCPCTFDRAMVYALLGRRDAAIRGLEKAYDERDAEMVQLYTNPAFDSMRSDPRLQALLHRMNFPP